MPEPAAPTFLTRARACLPCDGPERAELERALPPLAIVRRVSAVADLLVADGGACRDAEGADVAAAELEALAREIAAIWGEGGDWFALAERLDGVEGRRAARASFPPGAAVRGSDTHAWEPLDDASLGALLAAAEVAALREASEVFHPFGMWLACVATASLLRAAEAEPRLTLRDVTPHAWLADQGAHRALVLAALARLRRAVERGFPGVEALVRAKPSAARPAGPYRAHVVAEEAPEVEIERPGASPLEARLASAHLDALFDEAFDHALRAALHAHVPDALSRRVRMRQEAARGADAARADLALVRARGVVRVLELGLFPVALHEAVIELHSAAGGFAIEHALTQAPVIRHLGRAGRALLAVRSLLGLQLGLAVDADRLASDVAGHLRVASPRAPLDRYEELVHDVSQVLAGTSFVALHASLGPRAREVEDAVRGAAAADARVPWYERIFGEGPSALERDAHRASAEAAGKNLATTSASVRGYLEGALKAVQPQALAYFRTFELQRSLARVHLVETVDLVSARDVDYAIVGDRAFRADLETWTGDLLRAFGHLPSPGEVLETHALAMVEAAWPLPPR